MLHRLARVGRSSPSPHGPLTLFIAVRVPPHTGTTDAVILIRRQMATENALARHSSECRAATILRYT